MCDVRDLNGWFGHTVWKKLTNAFEVPGECGSGFRHRKYHGSEEKASSFLMTWKIPWLLMAVG